jgi:hypothetical protein
MTSVQRVPAAVLLGAICVALSTAAYAADAVGAHTGEGDSDAVYKCSDKDGAETLQNRPCANGSAVSVKVDRDTDPAAGTASAAAPAAEAPAGNEAGAAQPGQSAAHGATAADSDSDSDELANLPSEPALGMSQRQVQAILGPPMAVTQEEVVDGRVVTWTYGDSRMLQFDTAGRLSSK